MRMFAAVDRQTKGFAGCRSRAGSISTCHACSSGRFERSRAGAETAARTVGRPSCIKHVQVLRDDGSDLEPRLLGRPIGPEHAMSAAFSSAAAPLKSVTVTLNVSAVAVVASPSSVVSRERIRRTDDLVLVDPEVASGAGTSSASGGSSSSVWPSVPGFVGSSESAMGVFTAVPYPSSPRTPPPPLTLRRSQHSAQPPAHTPDRYGRSTPFALPPGLLSIDLSEASAVPPHSNPLAGRRLTHSNAVTPLEGPFHGDGTERNSTY